jgi:hypothetical protein
MFLAEGFRSEIANNRESSDDDDEVSFSCFFIFVLYEYLTLQACCKVKHAHDAHA